MQVARMAAMLILTMLAVQTAQADTWDGTTRTKPLTWGGVSGTSDGWIVIKSAAELAYIRDHWTEVSDVNVLGVDNYLLQNELQTGC